MQHIIMIHLNTIRFYDIEPPPLSELCSCYTSSSRSFKNQIHDVSPGEPFIALSLSLTVCDLLKIYARLTMNNIPTPLKMIFRFHHSLNNTEMIYVNDMFNLFNTKINFRIEVTVFCECCGPPTQCCWYGEQDWSHVHPARTNIQLTGASHQPLRVAQT